MAMRLTARVGSLTDDHAHITIYDAGGHSGALILSRKSWDALGDDAAMASAGDRLAIDCEVGGVVPGQEDEGPGRTARA